MGGVTHLLLLLWVGVTVSTAVDLQKRIVKGAKCGNTERLYHVKLVDNSNNFVCGGSLITNQWILTSEHCLPRATKAVVGLHPGPGQPGQIPIVTEIYKDGSGQKHDIMLWKLPNPTNIQPVAPPDCTKPPSSNKDQVQIAGQASSVGHCTRCNSIEPRTNDLQCANVGVIDCLWITNPGAYQKPHHHMFCGDTTNSDACHGDCGGAVLYNNMIYGVIQGGHGAPCTNPVIFMDVCSYMPWITTTTGNTFG